MTLINHPEKSAHDPISQPRPNAEPNDHEHHEAEHAARSTSKNKLKESISELVHRMMSPTRSTSRDRTGTDQRGRSPERKSHRTKAISTGRGGAGNMVSRESRERAAEIEKQDSLQGERLTKHQQQLNELPKSHGRGGAGNIRSPSRDPLEKAREEEHLRKLRAEERKVEASYEHQTRTDPISTGRGGAGNIIHN